MGAAAVPIAVGLGSMAAAKMSGASTAGILGAGALGGAGGYFAGPALGLTGGSASGLMGAGSLGSSVGGLFGNGGGGSTANPFGVYGATGGGGESGGGIPPLPGFSRNPQTGAVELGKSQMGGFASRPAPEKKADWWNMLSSGLGSVASIYGASEQLRRQQEEEERLKAVAAAKIQESLYRPAPNAGFAQGVGLGSYPGVGGGFSLGR